MSAFAISEAMQQAPGPKAIKPPQLHDTVHARLLRNFPELVETQGGDPAMLLARAGIDTRMLAQEQPITYRQFVNVIEHAAMALNCPDFGMRLGALQGSQSYGPLGKLMKHSRNFGKALDYANKYSFAHSFAARTWLRRSEENLVLVGHEILLDRIPNKSHAIEQILAIGHFGAAEMTGGIVRARKVHFRHAPISPLATYHRYFRCPVYFNRNEDGLFFSDRDLACPIIGHDASVHRRAITSIEGACQRNPPPLHALARGVITQFLGTHECTNARVAAELNMHERTLRRVLAREGTSFQQIKDEVRRDAMLYLIQHTDLEFSHVSERLGFAEPSVLSRHCRSWFSKSPTQLRGHA